MVWCSLFWKTTISGWLKGHVNNGFRSQLLFVSGDLRKLHHSIIQIA